MVGNNNDMKHKHDWCISPAVTIELFNSDSLSHVSASNGHSPHLEGSLPLGHSHSQSLFAYTCKPSAFHSQTQTMYDATNMHRKIRAVLIFTTALLFMWYCLIQIWHDETHTHTPLLNSTRSWWYLVEVVEVELWPSMWKTLVLHQSIQRQRWFHYPKDQSIPLSLDLSHTYKAYDTHWTDITKQKQFF